MQGKPGRQPNYGGAPFFKGGSALESISGEVVRYILTWVWPSFKSESVRTHETQAVG